MIIDQIRQNLFSIKNILPLQLIKEIRSTDLYSIPFTRQEWQEDWPRRKLLYNDVPTLLDINHLLTSSLSEIGNAIGKKLKTIHTSFWLDTEGFDCTAHFDNPGVKNVMQLYLSNCPNLGTVFYDNNEIVLKDDEQHYYYEGVQPPNSIVHEFPFIENTGYIMTDNHINPHLHGVPNTLKAGDIRLSVYCYLY